MRIGPAVAVVVGVALMALPAVLDYAGTTASDIHRVVGPVAATIGIIAFWPVTSTVRWCSLVLAPVLALAPVVVDHSSEAIIVGLAAAVALAASAPFGGRSQRRFGPGWRYVWSGHPSS